MMNYYNHFATMACLALALATNVQAQTTSNKTWDFTTISESDKTAFEANIAKGGEWTVDGSWWQNQKAIGQNSKEAVSYEHLYELTATKPLYTDNTTKHEPDYTKNLHFGIWNGGDESTPAMTKAIYKNLRIQSTGNARLYLAAKNVVIVIPDLQAGDSVEVTMAGNSADESHYLESMNLTPAFQGQPSNHSMKFLRKAKVAKKGNVVLRSNGGVYVYDITVKDKDGNVKAKENITTGISATKTNALADNRVYDLHGRYMGTNLSTLPRGIYIANGKKVAR